MIISNTNYSKTLRNIEQVKNALEELDKTMYSHISQGITIEYDRSKKLLINWLEEMEFVISTHKTYDCD